MHDFAFECGHQLAVVQLLSISMHLDVFFDYYGFITLVFSLALGLFICVYNKRHSGNTGSSPLPKKRAHSAPSCGGRQ